MKIFDADFFKVVEDDPSIESEVQQLLNQIVDYALPDPLLQLVLDFGPFLDQAWRNVRLERASINQLHQNTEASSKEWTWSTLSNQRVDALKAQALKNKDQILSYDQ